MIETLGLSRILFQWVLSPDRLKLCIFLT
jgi:hypothetical protein